MPSLIPFFIILLAGLLFSKLFNRLHLPWVVALILGGIVIGPHGFGLFEPNETIELIAQIGLVFLMFMAGLEIRLSSVRELGKSGIILPLINGFVPFLVGIGLARYLNLDINAALLLGVAFISSSVSVVVPSLESTGLLGSKLGHSVVTASVIEDTLSLLLLSVLLQTTAQTAHIPLPLLYVLLPLVLILLRRVVPAIRFIFLSKVGERRDMFEQEVRAIFTVLLGTVVMFELLGLHPIVAGFFAGLILSESIKSEILREKLHVLSYGIFIPVFFVFVGASTNIRIFTEVPGALMVTLLIIVSSVISKFASGWVGARLSGFSPAESSFVGVATTPQLSTTLAIVFAGSALEILSPEIVVGMVGLTIVTTFLAPLLIYRLALHERIGVISPPSFKKIRGQP